MFYHKHGKGPSSAGLDSYNALASPKDCHSMTASTWRLYLDCWSFRPILPNHRCPQSPTCIPCIKTDTLLVGRSECHKDVDTCQYPGGYSQNIQGKCQRSKADRLKDTKWRSMMNTPCHQWDLRWYCWYWFSSEKQIHQGSHTSLSLMPTRLQMFAPSTSMDGPRQDTHRMVQSLYNVC